MKNSKKAKGHCRERVFGFLCGVLTGALLLGLAIPALALSAGRSITVYPGVDIYVDDIKLNPTDVNGNAVEAFIYDGTTYLPVRAVSEALDINVVWDSATNSVFLGDHATGNTPVMSLYDLDYFNANGLYSLRQKTVADNLGIDHDTMAITTSRDANITYKLNGQYSALTGVFFLPFDNRDTSYEFTLKFYGDGKQLWTGTVSSGIEPINFDLDLSGILELKIEMKGEILSPIFYLGDTTLYQ